MNTAAIYVIAAYSPDGRRISALGADGSLWTFTTARMPRLVAHSTADGTSAKAGTLAYSSDGALVVASRGSRAPRLIDPNTGRIVATLAAGASDWYDTAFLPDGHGVVAVDSHQNLDLYRLDGSHVRTLAHLSGSTFAVAASPDGTHIAVTSGTQVALLTMDGHLLNTFTGHSAYVDAVAFSHDGQLIASGSLDGTVRIWDVHALDQVSSTPVPGGQVTTVAFDPGGRKIAAGGQSGAAFLISCEVCTDGAALATTAATRTTRPLTDGERVKFGVSSALLP
jgi:WD40 repeat protein